MRGVKKLENQGNSNFLIAQSNVFLIDWLTVTFKDISPEVIKMMLGLSGEEWLTKQSFKNGYPVDTFFGNIHIWYGADDPQYYTDGFNEQGKWITAEMKARTDMGVCLNLSGPGCRCFEEHSTVGWLSLFEMIDKYHGNITRLDIAYDDHMGVIDIYRFAYDIKERNYRSKAKYADVLWSDDQETDIQGITVYIGKKSSDVLIRVYDKAAERGFKDRHWIRVELQLRHDRAVAALQQLLQRESIGVVGAGILRNYLTVCVPSGDSNKSRWPVAYYWERILGQMETIRLWSAPGEPYNFHKAEDQMIKQYCQFLLTFKEIHGTIQDLLIAAQNYHGKKPLKKKYLNAINDHFARLKRATYQGCNSDDLHAHHVPGAYFSNDTFNLLYDDDKDLPW